MKKPIKHTIRSQGLDLSVFEWAGSSPPIMLVHASGFHARCWDKVVSFLENRRVFAIDLMGHGRSENPKPPLSWDMYSQNVKDVIEEFNLKDVIGVGHSLGGYCVTEVAGKFPNLFKGLILLDPVIFEPKHSDILNQYKPEELPVSRRKNTFKSSKEMFERLSGKGSFSLWDQDVLMDYCKFGLLSIGNECELACPPLIEAATYVSSGSFEIYEDIQKVTAPVLVVRARDRFEGESPMSFAYSPTNPELASLFTNGKDLKLETHSHFIPMQDPALTAKLIEEFITKI